jgi:hypothetical protein
VLFARLKSVFSTSVIKFNSKTKLLIFILRWIIFMPMLILVGIFQSRLLVLLSTNFKFLKIFVIKLHSSNARKIKEIYWYSLKALAACSGIFGIVLRLFFVILLRFMVLHMLFKLILLPWCSQYIEISNRKWYKQSELDGSFDEIGGCWWWLSASGTMEKGYLQKC